MTMNIKEAKEQIKNAMTAYFTKDEFGSYAVPVEKQRPVFLMGPPGIGKTAIMEQIAQELDVCLVSYSMTHHTRQSALGLPFIEKKVFNRKEYQVSEYTMSEIIASVYETMEATGKKEGILFLDEINCVSETLAPSMLQFLQYKIFGRHRVPEGWIVVTAGNPPEYNRSVREFDIVTWDRLKRIDVEPDFDAWKEFAYQKHVHPAVMTYLEIRKGDFYKVESTVNGKRFVTARGWDDLSQMIHLYEQNHLPVDEKLIIQYLQNPKIAKEFAVYYDLFNKYRSDYQVDKILAGKAPVSACAPAGAEGAAKIAAIMGMEAPSGEKMVAHVICNGGDAAVKNFEYVGIADCVGALKVAGGPTACSFGCLGFGSCVAACQFDALHINDKGVAEVDKEKCTNCGACREACPRKLIVEVPYKQKVFVNCANKNKGPAVTKVCANSCIACGMCERTCKFDAIHVVNNVAVIDYTKCRNCTMCAKACPKNAIEPIPTPEEKEKFKAAQKAMAEKKAAAAKAAAEAAAAAKAAEAPKAE